MTHTVTHMITQIVSLTVTQTVSYRETHTGRVPGVGVRGVRRIIIGWRRNKHQHEK